MSSLQSRTTLGQIILSFRQSAKLVEAELVGVTGMPKGGEGLGGNEEDE